MNNVIGRWAVAGFSGCLRVEAMPEADHVLDRWALGVPSMAKVAPAHVHPSCHAHATIGFVNTEPALHPQWQSPRQEF